MKALNPQSIWKSEDETACLYHGDSLKLLSDFDDESVDCIWTDPPYFLSNNGVTCVAGRMVSVNKGKWDKSSGVEADHEFNRAWLQECYRILKPSGTIWVSGTHHVYLSIGMAMMQLEFRILNDIIWEKTNPPPNLGCRCFTHSTETILWATKAQKGSNHRYTFNYDVLKQENQGKQMKNVWQFPAVSRDEKKYGKHPTQKPLPLVALCLKASTNEGDIILDPFSGSSTTGVAAMQLGRKFIGIENEQEFFDLSVKRLTDSQGLVAPSGLSFQSTNQISLFALQ